MKKRETIDESGEMNYQLNFEYWESRIRRKTRLVDTVDKVCLCLALVCFVTTIVLAIFDKAKEFRMVLGSLMLVFPLITAINLVYKEGLHDGQSWGLALGMAKLSELITKARAEEKPKTRGRKKKEDKSNEHEM